jgi:hypothetical protein
MQAISVTSKMPRNHHLLLSIPLVVCFSTKSKYPLLHVLTLQGLLQVAVVYQWRINI